MDASQPLEFEGLEQELKRLSALPSLDLRARVLKSVKRELRGQRLESWRWYCAAAAAALALGANLSWSVSRDTSYALQSREARPATVEQIEDLVPGLSRREAERQALLLNGGRVSRSRATAIDPGTRPASSNRVHSL